VSDRGDVETRKRRDCHDGLAPLYRLPVLRRGCPYGSRSFNWRDPRPFIKEINPEFPTRTRGVVEKCTFCEELLVKGNLPACVEACEHGAMVFGDLEDPESPVRHLLESISPSAARRVSGRNPKFTT